MFRRLAVAALAIGGLCGVACAHDGERMEGAASIGSVKSFVKHWESAKGLGVAIANAMPDVDYNFKPVPEEMSFGQQMMHIAQANYGYCAVIRDEKSPMEDAAKPDKVEKAAAVEKLGQSFDYCTEAFNKLSDSQLSQMHTAGSRKMAAGDIMLGVLIHAVHHRGQAEVYLRLKGVVPPKYTW